jgi:hypothetical protein
MNKISIVGSGNVAYHLCKVFSNLGFTIELFGRNKAEIADFEFEFKLKTVKELNHFDFESLVLICVNDSEIPNILNQLDANFSVAYTSGTVELHSLPKRENLGVFYPLQTISKNRKTNFFELPILIEGNNNYFAQTLFDLAWKVSRKVYFADSEKRKHLHLAAVFANNFSNHMLHISKTYLDQNDIDWEILKPLIKETFAKIEDGLTPFEAQTGPAVRNDIKTIETHVGMLENENKDIYKLLSQNMQKTHSKK